MDPMYNSPAPGVGATRTATPRLVTLGNERYLPGLFIIDGSKSRDPGNTPVTELRAGMLIGRITSGKKFAPSVIGTLTVAHTSDVGTTMTVSAATAAELVRRVGASGTFKLTGPPTAGGVVATQTITYSAVNESTGVITITATATDFIAGSFVQPTDGSETPATILSTPQGFPLRATDYDGASRDLDLERYLIEALVDSSQIVNWPSDTSLRQWIVDQLNALGKFTFDHKHGL